MARPKTDFKNFRLRLPPDMYQQITDAAEIAGRSMNTEIIYRLGETLDPRWQEYVAAIEEEERLAQESMERLRQNPRLMEQVRKLIAEADEKGTLPKKGKGKP
jgi:hypothetical protein